MNHLKTFTLLAALTALFIGLGYLIGGPTGMLIALVVGAILQKTGSYVPIFVMAASAYLVALVIIQLLVPQLAPADLDTDPTT